MRPITRLVVPVLAALSLGASALALTPSPCSLMAAAPIVGTHHHAKASHSKSSHHATKGGKKHAKAAHHSKSTKGHAKKRSTGSKHSAKSRTKHTKH